MRERERERLAMNVLPSMDQGADDRMSERYLSSDDKTSLSSSFHGADIKANDVSQFHGYLDKSQAVAQFVSKGSIIR